MTGSNDQNKVLFVILNKTEYLQDLMVLLVELGLKGATVIDSVGMGKILTQDIPIFAGMRSLLTGARPSNKTIMMLLHEEMIPLVVEAFEHTVGPLDQPGNGVIFSLPVDFVYGAGEAAD